ncbi:MAG TPA: glycosyltransferase family 39 protein, partial [Candidatus Udaeobacter sp.]|nr:glycosyltransferase family 39 protein [Candidatus Udaeobacter sp.]
MFVLKPWHRAIWIIVFTGAAMSVLAWMAWKNPAINFLRYDRRAEWIVFPAAVDAHAHWFASLDATFRREFDLAGQPSAAALGIRAMRRAEVKINGNPVRFPPNGSWKEIISIDVAKQLHAGTNVIEARVFNHNGPPALWLNLIADHLSLGSDESWDASFAGSPWRHAGLAAAAKTPKPGNSIAGGEGTFEAFRKIWTFWIVLIAIASVATLIWNLSLKNSTARWLEKTLLLVVAGLWLLLFWNNSRLLPFHAGFDAKEHLKYVNYIEEHRALPLPNEGWEMYQPPLYYLITAAGLSACNLSINDPTSILVLRLIGAFLGIAQFVFVFLGLRLLFSGQTAFVGLLLAAFLPMHLYLAHYVTNEILAAALATATLYSCLRLLRSDTPHTSQFAWLGLALGAAMLAKATSVLLL